MKPNEIIKKYRKKAGLTQQQLAKSLFIATNTYNQYETGKRNIDADMFLSILKILNIDIFFEDLYNLKDDTLVVDIFLVLQKFQNTHSFPLINISYSIEDLIIEEEIDKRWIDFISFEIDDELNFFLSIDNFTIDFDSKGRKIGSGRYTKKVAPPWKNVSKKTPKKIKKQKKIPLNINELIINPSSVQYNYRHNHIFIQFEIEHIGFYVIDVFYVFNNDEYTWKFGELYHDFPLNSNSFACPFCSSSHDGEIPATECHCLNPYSKDIFYNLSQYLPNDILNVNHFKK